MGRKPWSLAHGKDSGFEVKVAKALQMRVDGASLSRIAEEVGVNTSTVSRWIKKALAEARRHGAETAEEIAAIENRRIDEVIRVQTGIMIANAEGNPTAATAAGNCLLAAVKTRIALVQAAGAHDTQMQAELDAIRAEVMGVVVGALARHPEALADVKRALATLLADKAQILDVQLTEPLSEDSADE